MFVIFCLPQLLFPPPPLNKTHLVVIHRFASVYHNTLFLHYLFEMFYCNLIAKQYLFTLSNEAVDKSNKRIKIYEMILGTIYRGEISAEVFQVLKKQRFSSKISSFAIAAAKV